MVTRADGTPIDLADEDARAKSSRFLTALISSVEILLGLIGSGYIVTQLGHYSGWLLYGAHTTALVAAMFGFQRAVGFAVRKFAR